MGEQMLNHEIQTTINQQPLKDPLSQSILNRWCIDSNFRGLKIVSRQEWQQQRNILENNTISVPADLQLWEMVGVMEAVDRSGQSAEKIQRFGQTLKNAGVYIAQRLGSIIEGRQIAATMAEQFYNYGNSLKERIKTPPKTLNEIRQMKITAKQTWEVDLFLAGDDLYQSRMTRAQQESQAAYPKRSPVEIYEDQRKKTLAQYFRVTQKAYNIRRQEKFYFNKPHSSDIEHDILPIHERFIQQIEESIQKQIEQPISELDTAIFRHGMTQSPDTRLPPSIIEFIDKSPESWDIEGKKIAEILKLDRFKLNIDSLRKKHEGPKKISHQERLAAKMIQRATATIIHQRQKDIPNLFLKEESVLASTIGGQLMQEIGLNYLVGNLPGYSILLLVLNDGQIKIMDMTNPLKNISIKNEQTSAEIIAFSQEPKPEGFRLSLEDKEFRQKFPWVSKNESPCITLYPPEHGQKVITLFNHAADSYAHHNYQESVVLFEKIMEFKPQDEEFTYFYGEALSTYAYQNRNLSKAEKQNYLQKAIGAFHQVTMLNPQNDKAYSSLGRIWDDAEDYKKAINAYDRAVKINHKDKESKKRAKYLKKTYKFAA